MAKVAIALSIALVLLYFGLQGAQRARLQGRLEDMTLVRDQLQEKMDEILQPTEPLATSNSNASRSLFSNPQVTALIGALKRRLEQFDTEVGLSETDQLRVRLSTATVANAEQRFTDALMVVTDEDESRRRASAEPPNGDLLRILQVRGDSFYGLHDWQKALERYLQLQNQKPKRVVTIARITACHTALGRRSEALTALGELAKSLNWRGKSLLAQSKADEAVAFYQHAIDIQTQLIQQEQRSDLAAELAKSYTDRGNALLFMRKPDAAVADFKNAVEMYAILVKQGGGQDLALQYARCLSSLAWIYATDPGNSLRDGGKAREYALKACELSEWKTVAPLEALAAACAETGNFADAVKWQEKALELAPANSRSEVRTRLDIYKSGKPIRTLSSSPG